MVKKVESFVSHDGKMFLNEEAAVRHECLQRLCEIIPEFQMVRSRIEAQLDAVATAMGPMVAFRARVPSKPAIVDPSACTCQRYPTHCANDCPLHGLEELGELAGGPDCTCGVSLTGSPSHHKRGCPIYESVRGKPKRSMIEHTATNGERLPPVAGEVEHA